MKKKQSEAKSPAKSGTGKSGTGKSAAAASRPRLRASHTDGPSPSRGRHSPAEKSSKASEKSSKASEKSNKLAKGDPASNGKAAKGNSSSQRGAGKKPPKSTRGTKRAAVLNGAGVATHGGDTRRHSLPDTGRKATDEARELATAIAIAGIDKKASGVEVLDVASKVDYADFIVIMTGTSDRHVQSIAQGIEDSMHKHKVRPLSIEGLNSGTWVLIDFGDVVVHVFQEDSRQVYDLEGLWIDASRIPTSDLSSPPSV